jgi:hypothetical protein
MAETDQLERARSRQRIVNAYHRIFQSDDGKTILDDLNHVFGMDRPVFIPLDRGRGSMGYDSIHAAKRDGQQDILRHVNAKLEASCEGDANFDKPKTTIRT